MKFIFWLGCILVCLLQHQANSTSLQSGGTNISYGTDYYDMGPDVELFIDTSEVGDDTHNDATTDDTIKYITSTYEKTETTSKSYSSDNLFGNSVELTTEKPCILKPENDKPCEHLYKELDDAREYQNNLHIKLNNSNESLMKVTSELEICTKVEMESKNELVSVKSDNDLITSKLHDTEQKLAVAIIDLEYEKELSVNTISSLKNAFNISEAQNALKLRHFMTLSSQIRIKYEKSEEEKSKIDAKFKLLQHQYEQLIAEKYIVDQNLKDSAIQLKTCVDSEKSLIVDLNNTKFMLEEALVKEIDMVLTIENLTVNRDNLKNMLDIMTANFDEKEEELRVCLSKNHNRSLQEKSSLNKENELLNRLKTTEGQNKLLENHLQLAQREIKICEDQIQSYEALFNRTKFEIKSYVNDTVEDIENDFALDETDFLNYTMLLTKQLATKLNLSINREQNLSAQIESVTQQYLKAVEELEVYSQREESLNLKLKSALQSDNITKDKLESSIQEITKLSIELNQTAQQKSMIQSILEENKNKLTEINTRLKSTTQLLNSTKLELLESKQIEKKMKEKMSSIITSQRNETKELRFCNIQSVRLQSYLSNAMQYWNKTEHNLIVAKEKIEKMDKRVKAAQKACRDKNLSIEALNRQIMKIRTEIASCRNQVNNLNNQLNDRKDVKSDNTRDAHSKLQGSKLQPSTSNSERHEPTTSTIAAEQNLICESKIQEKTSKLKTDLDSCTENALNMKSEKLRVSHILLDKSMRLDMCIPKKKSNGSNNIYKPARIFSGTYYFNPKRLTWWMARDFCRDRGMDLVSIETAEENEGLKVYIHKIITHNGSRYDNESRLSKPDIAWTSGCFTNEGWTWNSTGNALTFSNWMQPITVKQNDTRCLLLQASNGAWLNLDPKIALPSLCELPN